MLVEAMLEIHLNKQSLKHKLNGIKKNAKEYFADLKDIDSYEKSIMLAHDWAKVQFEEGYTQSN